MTKPGAQREVSAVATAEKPPSDIGQARQAIANRGYMVEKYLPLGRRLAWKVNTSGESLEDLVQLGAVGLIKAIEKYDPTKGSKFESYAIPVIVGEIKNYFRDHGWAVKVPRKLQAQWLSVRKAVESLEQALGRSPRIQEIVEATGFSREEVMDTFELASLGNPLSLDNEYQGDNGEESYTLMDSLGDEDPRFEEMIDQLDLTEALATLNPREKTIIHLKFFGALSQTQIGNRIGISQMHVSRLQRTAINKLRLSLTATAETVCSGIQNRVAAPHEGSMAASGRRAGSDGKAGSHQNPNT